MRAAFGLTDGATPDRFLIGAGTLTLLTELADERPVLCLVDDAQWLDQESVDALLFAARPLPGQNQAIADATLLGPRRHPGRRGPRRGLRRVRPGPHPDVDPGQHLLPRVRGTDRAVAAGVGRTPAATVSPGRCTCR